MESFILAKVNLLHDRLDRLERKMDQVLALLGSAAAARGQASGAGPSDLVVGLVRSGHRLQAVKAYREQTGVSLAEAELVVDAIGRGP